MKEVFNAVQAKITADVTAVRWVDFDLGQLDAAPPPVSFPCALIDMYASTVEPTSDATTTETLVVEVTIGFKLRERTHSKAATNFKDEALGHLDVVDAVRAALDGLSGSTFNAMTYSGFTRDRRADYRVYHLTFTCSSFPPAAEDPYVPWVDGGGIGVGPGFCIHPDVP